MIILGHNHLESIRLKIPCLHKTSTVLDCANLTVTGAMGVFYGCVRGKSATSGRTLVHRGMNYVIEGDIVLLSQAASKDLGVIPQTFPMIGEFTGVEQIGDGCDNL